MPDAKEPPLALPIEHKPMACKFCGAKFIPSRAHQEFCTRGHRIEFHKIAAARGGQVYEKLMRWRLSRGRQKGLLGDVAAVIDGWIDADRRARAARTTTA